MAASPWQPGPWPVCYTLPFFQLGRRWSRPGSRTAPGTSRCNPLCQLSNLHLLSPPPCRTRHHAPQGLLFFRLPPVSMAACSLAWAAATSARGPRLCSTCMQHRGSRWRMEVAYRLLEPLVAPLEPLLLAAGVVRGHPHRHCYCGALLVMLPPCAWCGWGCILWMRCMAAARLRCKQSTSHQHPTHAMLCRLSLPPWPSLCSAGGAAVLGGGAAAPRAGISSPGDPPSVSGCQATLCVVPFKAWQSHLALMPSLPRESPVHRPCAGAGLQDLAGGGAAPRPGASPPAGRGECC